MKKIVFKSFSIPIILVIIIGILISLNSCSQTTVESVKIKNLGDSISKLNLKIGGYAETIFFKNSQITTLNDSINKLNIIGILYKNNSNIYRDSVLILNNKLLDFNKKPETINYNNYSALYKLARIERYVKICDNKPSNKKYFFGWIKRAIEQ